MSAHFPPRWDIEGLFDVSTIVSKETRDVHWHSHYMLSLVVSGSATHIINGTAYQLKERSVILMSPLDFHKDIFQPGEQLQLQIVKFSDKLFLDKLSDFCNVESFPVMCRLSPADFATAQTLFALLQKEVADRKALGMHEFSCSLIQQLVILALRNPDVRIDTEQGNRQIRRAMLYTQSHFREELTVAQVAEVVGYSPNYFSSKFRKETGEHFQVYLQNMRLAFAKNLLEYSGLSITEICLESGFRTLPHFINTFKRRYGSPPDKFRHRKGETQ